MKIRDWLLKIREKKLFFMIVSLVVLIIGLVFVVTGIFIQKKTEPGRKKYYLSKEEEIINNTKKYARNMSLRLGESVDLKFNEISDNKVLDYRKNECDLEKSYVRVTRYTNTDYSYYVNFYCSDYKSSKNKGPVIKTNYKNLEEKYKFNISVDDSDKLMGYSYTVTDSNGVEVDSSGFRYIKDKDSYKKNINFKGNLPGTFNIVITAKDIYGNETVKKEEKSFKDIIPPVCKEVSFDDVTVLDYALNKDIDLNWKNSDRKIAISCVDKGSGCKQDEFIKVFDTDIKKSYIEISDNSGNVTKCDVPVYVDKTAPECKVTYAGGTLDKKSGWFTITSSKDKVTSYGVCTDELSGCLNERKFLIADYSGSGEYTNIYPVYDRAGNYNECVSEIKIK